MLKINNCRPVRLVSSTTGALYYKLPCCAKRHWRDKKIGFIELVSRIVDFDLSAGVLYYLLIQFLSASTKDSDTILMFA